MGTDQDDLNKLSFLIEATYLDRLNCQYDLQPADA